MYQAELRVLDQIMAMRSVAIHLEKTERGQPVTNVAEKWMKLFDLHQTDKRFRIQD